MKHILPSPLTPILTVHLNPSLVIRVSHENSIESIKKPTYETFTHSKG